MTYEEYCDEKERLQKEYRDNLLELDQKCTSENNPFKIGDIISNGMKVIKIERIETESFGNNFILPYCVYYGTELTRAKLLPKKTQKPNAYIKQNCRIEKIG